MQDGLRISIEAPDAAVLDAIDEALEQHTRERSARPPPEHINIMLRDREGRLRGGVVAKVGFDVLYIDMLWIDEELRHGDYGTALMTMAEDEGRRKGAILSWVDTYSWQARPFYEKLGYKVFGELPYKGGEHARYFMRKDL